MFLLITEIIVFALILFVAITQIATPLINGSRLFPFFRAPIQKLEEELVEAKEKQFEQEVRAEIQEIKHKTSYNRQRQRAKKKARKPHVDNP